MSPASLSTLRLPIPWEALGMPTMPLLGSTTVIDGDRPAWAWTGPAPSFPIEECEDSAGSPVDGWVTDHVVLLVPDIEEAVAVLAEAGHRPRLRMEVKGRPTAFFRVGPVLEVIRSPVRAPALYGVALATEEALEVVALRWRSLGFEVTDPRPAIQAGRRIMTVRGLAAGLAVMSMDRAVQPDRS